MTFAAYDDAGATLRERTYYSVGGGFVVEEGAASAPESGPAPPHGFTTAAEMLAEGARANLTIADLQRANERTRRSDQDISAGQLSGVLDGPETRTDSGVTVGPTESLDPVTVSRQSEVSCLR